MTHSTQKKTGVSTLILKELQSFATALVFLTRLPLAAAGYNEQYVARSVLYFPAVGLVIGIIAAATFSLCHQLWSTGVALAVSFTVAILATGAFHEDGLADSADGLGGGWTVAHKLEIMRDSRIGTYGAMALILITLLKFTALLSLDARTLVSALVIGHVLGRWSTLPLLAYCPYVGAGSGKGFAGAVTHRYLLIGSCLPLAVVLLFSPASAFLLIVVAILVTLLGAWYCHKKIGGISGDTLGAINQIVALSVYLTIAASVR